VFVVDESVDFSVPSADWTRDPLTDQINVVTREGRFYCSLCNKSYTDKGNCATHIRSHLGHTTCHICNKSFARMENLRRHLQKHEGNIQCPKCFRTYGSKYSLNYHLRNSKCDADAYAQI